MRRHGAHCTRLTVASSNSLWHSPRYKTLILTICAILSPLGARPIPSLWRVGTQTSLGVVEVAWRFPLVFLSSWDKERANGNLRAALAALAHGLEVAAEVRDRAHAAHLGGPRPDRRREAPHLPLWHALCVRYFKRPVGGGNGDASYTQDHIVAQAQRAVPRA